MLGIILRKRNEESVGEQKAEFWNKPEFGHVLRLLLHNWPLLEPAEIFVECASAVQCCSLPSGPFKPFHHLAINTTVLPFGRIVHSATSIWLASRMSCLPTLARMRSRIAEAMRTRFSLSQQATLPTVENALILRTETSHTRTGDMIPRNLISMMPTSMSSKI